MHRVVYFCDWLPPDFGAVGQYSVLFARERARAGQGVTLVGLSSSGPSSTEERLGAGSLRVLRIHRPTYERADLSARLLWTAITNLRLLKAARRALLESDEILITGSPPFLLLLAAPLASLLGKRLTYRITDFHPECTLAELAEGEASGRAEAFGEAGPWPLRVFYRFVLALRSRVDEFEVLGEDQRRRLNEVGIAAERISLRRDPSPVDIPAATTPLPLPADLAGHKALLYSGNFGLAHDYKTFIAGYKLHHREGSGSVRLWLNATGARATVVEEALRRENLPVVRGYPVPLSELPRLLVAADAHLITLRDAFVGFVLPSKVYACIASRRPILFVGSEDSDVHLLCQREAIRYDRASVGDVEAVAAALERLGSE
jgi:hypothetical protein